VDVGTVAIVALMAGAAGGAIGAALVGTIQTMLRRQLERRFPARTRTFRAAHTYTANPGPEK
jgi:hypothetical protein